MAHCFSTLRILATVKLDVIIYRIGYSFSTLRILATVKRFEPLWVTALVLVPLEF